MDMNKIGIKEMNLKDLEELVRLGELIASGLGIIVACNRKAVTLLMQDCGKNNRLLFAKLGTDNTIGFKTPADRIVITLNQNEIESKLSSGIGIGNSERVVSVFVENNRGQQYKGVRTEYKFKTPLYEGRNREGLKNLAGEFTRKFKKHKSFDFMLSIREGLNNIGIMQYN